MAVENITEEHVTDARRLQEKVQALRAAENRLNVRYEDDDETVAAAREYLVARANLGETVGDVDVGP